MVRLKKPSNFKFPGLFHSQFSWENFGCLVWFRWEHSQLLLICLSTYSCIPITRAGSIKRAGRIFLQILINEQVLIRASRLEKIKILAVKLQSGRNFHDIFKNEQALLRASRLENDQKFLVRACSCNRDTRVFPPIRALTQLSMSFEPKFTSWWHPCTTTYFWAILNQKLPFLVV